MIAYLSLNYLKGLAMATVNKKTEATTVATAENMNEEAAIVEVELTAEQKIEAKIEAEYGAKALAGRKSIKAIVNELENGKNQLTMNTLSLGYTLVDTYINFLNEEREHFWEIVDTKTRSQKTMERAIKLVLETNVELSEAMDATGGTEDIEENVKSLTLDKRMFDLYNDNLSNVKKPTIAKIRNMKGLSLEDWDITCSGKSEKPYKKHMDEIAEEAADKKAEQILADKPNTMLENVYLEYIKEDKLFSIKKIAVLEAILAKNGLFPKEDSELSDIPTEGKLTTVSKSESGEK
jgi:hypothetical protein